MSIERESGMDESSASDVPDTSSSDMTDQETSPEEALAKTLASQLTALSGQTAGASKELGELFRLELQLSAGDAGRLVLTWLALVPALILAWISLCGLVAWLVYDLSTSISLSLTTFTILQFAMCIMLLSLRKRFRRGIGFRRSKIHVKKLLQGITETGGDQ